MQAAYFYDERFTRDGATYFSTGSLPYRAFARYLKHFDGVVVVGRLGHERGSNRTVASGPGVEWALMKQRGLPSPGYLAAMARHASEVVARVDAVVVRLPGVVGVLGARAAELTGKPWMAEVVADPFETLWNHGSLVGKIAAGPMMILNRRWIARARFAIYVTKQMLQRRYPTRGVWVAASNVIVEATPPEVLDQRLRAIDDRDPSSPPAVGLVGSYAVGYKGHETALRGLAELRRSGRIVALRCIGGGDPARWRARAEALGVSEQVELGAAVPQGAPVVAWMERLDALVVPSLTEGLPRCLVEAMSRALPAVGSAAGGIPELLEPAWLHAPGDHRRLARLLATLLADREEMKAQARRNWRVAGEYAADLLEARRSELIGAFRAASVRAALASRPRPEDAPAA
jgi:glycosyltransferase involved in cell wall biosynthesis